MSAPMFHLLGAAPGRAGDPPVKRPLPAIAGARRLRARCLAALLAGLLAGACTHEVPLPPVEAVRLRVDWPAQALPHSDLDGVDVQGLVFTPAQWPLEASLKKLTRGDLVGVIEAFDLRFKLSTLPGGALQELFDQGFVPAYVRVENRAGAPRRFLPERLALQVDGTRQWQPAAPEELPTSMTAVDWRRTGMTLIAITVLVVVLAAQSRNRNVSVAGNLNLEPLTRESPPAPGGPAAPSAQDVLLTPRELAPGEAAEGLVLFRQEGAATDWRTARLVVN